MSMYCGLEPAKAFIGEVGVHRKLPHLCDRLGQLDDDYDHDNPFGSMYGRRTSRTSVYLSGTAGVEPGAYWGAGFDFYREYR
jgi:hypothetical protein